VASERRFAFIVASSRYTDLDLQKLIAPAKDAESLARVLNDPVIGSYEVKSLLNQPSYKVNEEIQAFVSECERDDLLLIYFSCHGIKDQDGLLYFATTNTSLKVLVLRGVDLSGIVDFTESVLHNVDFTGSVSDKGQINFNEASISNAKGLQVLEYLDSLKAFSESVDRQFKTKNISTEKLKPINESVKELVKEVESLQEPEKISDIKRENLNKKFIDIVGKVIDALSITPETRSIFSPLTRFDKLHGGTIQEIVDAMSRYMSKPKTQGGIYSATTRYSKNEGKTDPPKLQESTKPEMATIPEKKKRSIRKNWKDQIKQIKEEDIFVIFFVTLGPNSILTF
jgi:Caspase domain